MPYYITHEHNMTPVRRGPVPRILMIYYHCHAIRPIRTLSKYSTPKLNQLFQLNQ